MRDEDMSRPRPAKFGRIDPFCWLLVIPMLVVALGIVFIADTPLVGAGVGFGAACVLVFDSWINRPRDSDSGRRTPRSAPSRSSRESVGRYR